MGILGCEGGLEKGEKSLVLVEMWLDLSHRQTDGILMNKRNTVFVGISLIYVQDIFDGVEIATTLSGLCRMMGVNYGAVRRTWSRRGTDESIDVWDNRITKRWRVFEKAADTTWRKGNPEFGKKIKAGKGGFLGMKGGDGRLHAKAGKNRMGYDEVVNSWKEGDPE